MRQPKLMKMTKLANFKPAKMPKKKELGQLGQLFCDVKFSLERTRLVRQQVNQGSRASSLAIALRMVWAFKLKTLAAQSYRKWHPHF